MVRLWIYIGGLEQCLGYCSVRLARPLAAGEFFRDVICYTIVMIALVLALAAPSLAEEKKDGKPDETPAADLYALPEGSPKELKEYIQKIIRNMPQDEETRNKARSAMLQAADKILAAQSGDKDLDFAVDVKMRLLDTTKDIAAFSETLKKAGHEKQSRTVRSYALQIDLRDAILSGKLDLQRKQIAAALDYFKEAPPQSSDLSLAIMVGQIAELQGDKAYASDIYAKLGKLFKDSKEEQLAGFGKRLDGMVRRLSLLGDKMQLEGELLSGEAFDYSKYQGKVVLINFWASWRQACLADLPKLKKYYELYHDKGFEIIGFSCDYRREDAEIFVQENKIPWATVYGEKRPSPTIEYYGVMTIPMMILVGKDGNVTDLNVNIDDLPKQLEKILGPAEKKKPM